MSTPRVRSLAIRLSIIGAVLFTLGVPASLALPSPQPGETYKEFTRIMASGSKQWRVTHPNASAAGSPGNSPADFLPNPALGFSIDDLAGAIRAEAIIDYWGGHPGTTGQQFRFNGNDWLNVPELASLPKGREECYVQQWNVVMDVPLNDLISGTNVIEGTAGKQTCYNFGWGQWGWYMVMCGCTTNRRRRPRP